MVLPSYVHRQSFLIFVVSKLRRVLYPSPDFNLIQGRFGADISQSLMKLF